MAIILETTWKKIGDFLLIVNSVPKIFIAKFNFTNRKIFYSSNKNGYESKQDKEKAKTKKS